MSVAALDRPFFYSAFRLKKTQVMARASQQNKSEKSPQSGVLRYRRIVVKAGTGAITGPSGLDAEVMADLVRQVCQVRDASGEVLLVTSGAIAAGRSALGQTRGELGPDISSRQVFAAVGQSRLMHIYQEMFARKQYPRDINIDKYAAIQRDLPEALKPRVVLCQSDGELLAGLVLSTIGDTAIAMYRA